MNSIILSNFQLISVFIENEVKKNGKSVLDGFITLYLEEESEVSKNLLYQLQFTLEKNLIFQKIDLESNFFLSSLLTFDENRKIDELLNKDLVDSF